MDYFRRQEYFKEVSKINTKLTNTDWDGRGQEHWDCRERRDELIQMAGRLAPMEIAAPMKDFDTTNMKLEGFKLSKIEVPDPVVLHPVMFKNKKYYLIVTAWGLEGSDELVVNQRNN